MTRQEIKAMLEELIPKMEITEGCIPEEQHFKSTLLGSFMSLDPCGRYHHVISPNGVSAKCLAFWENLEQTAIELGGWTEGGEGDPSDIFFCMPAPEETKEETT